MGTSSHLSSLERPAKRSPPAHDETSQSLVFPLAEYVEARQKFYSIGSTPPSTRQHSYSTRSPTRLLPSSFVVGDSSDPSPIMRTSPCRVDLYTKRRLKETCPHIMDIPDSIFCLDDEETAVTLRSRGFPRREQAPMTRNLLVSNPRSGRYEHVMDIAGFRWPSTTAPSKRTRANALFLVIWESCHLSGSSWVKGKKLDRLSLYHRFPYFMPARHLLEEVVYVRGGSMLLQDFNRVFFVPEGKQGLTCNGRRKWCATIAKQQRWKRMPRGQA